MKKEVNTYCITDKRITRFKVCGENDFNQDWVYLLKDKYCKMNIICLYILQANTVNGTGPHLELVYQVLGEGLELGPQVTFSGPLVTVITWLLGSLGHSHPSTTIT